LLTERSFLLLEKKHLCTSSFMASSAAARVGIVGGDVAAIPARGAVLSREGVVLDAVMS
jgi:hypothetical protein